MASDSKGMGCGTMIVILIVIGWIATKMDSPQPTTETYTNPALGTKYDTKNTTITPKAKAIETPKATETVTLKPATEKEYFTNLMKEIDTFNKFNKYKTLSLAELNTRVQTMRLFGKMIYAKSDNEERSTDKEYKSLYKKAKKKIIAVQVKHYPKMRDQLGPLMRNKMWEHDVHVKTIGKGYRRIVFTAAYFASNRNIKSMQDSISTMLHDYRFKRADYKWVKSASEWTYFSIESKKDNEL